jgi:hypothetical protein
VDGVLVGDRGLLADVGMTAAGGVAVEPAEGVETGFALVGDG